MKKLLLFTAILMLVLCTLLLVGCDEETPETDDAASAPAAVVIPSASELGKGISLSASQRVTYEPIIEISYNYGEFNF